MRFRSHLVVLACVGSWCLACAGQPTAPQPEDPAPIPTERSEPQPVASEPRPAPDPSARIVEQWLEAELAGPDTGTPPVIDPSEREERRSQLTEFLQRTPAAATWAELTTEVIRQQRKQAEAAYEQVITDFAPKPPGTVEVSDAEPWRILATFAFSYQTSDDWGWYTAESGNSAQRAGVVVTHLPHGQHSLQITRSGQVIATVELPEEHRVPYAIGYLMAEQGKPPAVTGHDMAPGVVEAMNAYYSTDIEHVPLQ